MMLATLAVTLAQHVVDSDKCKCNNNHEIVYFWGLTIWKWQSVLLTLLDRTLVGGSLRTSIHLVCSMVP